MTQSLSIFHDIRTYLDKNVKTNVISLDFVKVFNNIDHKILLAQVKVYGSLLNYYNVYCGTLVSCREFFCFVCIVLFQSCVGFPNNLCFIWV